MQKCSLTITRCAGCFSISHWTVVLTHAAFTSIDQRWLACINLKEVGTTGGKEMKMSFACRRTKDRKSRLENAQTPFLYPGGLRNVSTGGDLLRRLATMANRNSGPGWIDVFQGGLGAPRRVFDSFVSSGIAVVGNAIPKCSLES